MKIGIVCYPTHGGSGVIASELALGLAEKGHEIHIVSYTTPFSAAKLSSKMFLIHEVDVLSYPLFKISSLCLVRWPPKLVAVAKEYSLELIHAHYAVPHAASAFLAKKNAGISGPQKRSPRCTETDITLVGLDESFYEVIKFNIEESDGVDCCPPIICSGGRLISLPSDARFRVIHNFVDTRRYSPGTTSCAKDHFAPHGEKILMHASNFRPLKRTADVVRIFERVRQQIPAKLLLVGEGPDRLKAQQLAKELGLSQDVFFLGEQDYLENLMSCADLFVLPSEQESFGLVALEAQSSALPVIGTAIGGLPEVVLNEQTGFLLPVGEIEDMAEGALRLLKGSFPSMTLFENAPASEPSNVSTAKLIIPPI